MSERKKIFILSMIFDPWGGSESIWFENTPALQSMGYEVTVLKRKIKWAHPNFLKLATDQVKLIELVEKSRLFRILKKNTLARWVLGSFEIASLDSMHLNFYRQVKKDRPAMVLINQGINFDGLPFGFLCKKLGIPYAFLSHKAVDFYWPPTNERKLMLEAIRGSRQNFFVSKQNLEITQGQFGVKIPNALLVQYPIKRFVEPVPFPEITDFLELACIGRIFLIDKGQDILLRVLALDKWRNRKIRISFVGSGPDEKALKEMVVYLELINVEFKGFLDTSDIWSSFHGLILPSRSEGFAMVVQEAMAAGRVVIATRAGGNSELIEDDENGFLAEANVTSLDEALERAWNRKIEFEEMGKLAFKKFNFSYSDFPKNDFAQKLNSLINGQ
jgi:glycosyltransferase involved in cell wall biosynthesis